MPRESCFRERAEGKPANHRPHNHYPCAPGPLWGVSRSQAPDRGEGACAPLRGVVHREWQELSDCRANRHGLADQRYLPEVENG